MKTPYQWRDEQFIYALMPSKETNIDFQVSLKASCSVFISATGVGNADDYFSTTSVPIKLVVEDVTQNDILAF